MSSVRSRARLSRTPVRIGRSKELLRLFFEVPEKSRKYARVLSFSEKPKLGDQISTVNCAESLPGIHELPQTVRNVGKEAVHA